MATDDEYMDFLEKANRDPSDGYAKPQHHGGGGGTWKSKTVDDGVEVPPALKKVVDRGDAFLVSDADEPFVAVALRLGPDEVGGGDPDAGQSALPDEEQFAALIGDPRPAKAEVEIMDPSDWDVDGKYTELIDAVRQAGRGNDVRVYRIVKSGTRVEYWLLTTTADGKDLVGLMALAVES